MINDDSVVPLTLRTGQIIDCKIDTGADVSLIPRHVLQELSPELERCIQPSNTVLRAFNRTNIKVCGQVTLECTHGKYLRDVRFIVVPHHTMPLLSKTDAVELGYIKFLKTHIVQARESQPAATHTIYAIHTASNKGQWKKHLPLGKTGDAKEEILKLFPECFNGVGKLKTPYRIELTPDAIPVRHAQRIVPEATKPKIKKELDDLVKNGIIRPVTEPTDWVNSLVCADKPDGSIRLCLDPKDLNQYIKRPLHYTPTIDDVLPDLSDAKYFTVIDAKSGYWHIPLVEESQVLTTFNTPGYGRYCFQRLPMGLKCAQDVFQKCMDEILLGLPRVTPVADDILIHAATEEEHDTLLLETLQRCKKAGLNLNPTKCNVKKSDVKFFGNIITTEGLRPDPKKVKAIDQLEAPKNKQEARSLIGMATYLSRYIPNFSALMEPIRQLVKNDVHFLWQHEQEAAFASLKKNISKHEALRYFSKHKETIIQTDASIKGLGAVLLQDECPVYYVSKTLTAAERNYSNIEREMLGVTFALNRLHQYTYGRPVTVITDHKPLEAISRKPLSEAPPRLQRMLLEIQKYDYTITYTPAKNIPIPDCLSRLIPEDRPDRDVAGMDVNILQFTAVPQSKLKMVHDHTEKDETMCMLRDTIIRGWPANRSQVPTSLLCYWPFKEDLGYYNGIIVKGSRILVPPTLKEVVLQDIHRGHLGIEKCKSRARENVFWPQMNSDITNMIQSCEQCQIYAPPPRHSYDLSIQQESHYPLHYVGMDIFEHKGKYYLLAVDYFSSFPWLRQLPNITTSSVIYACKTIFQEFGYPVNLHTDTGTQFTSSEFKEFMLDYNVNHTQSSPYYHQSNGKAERYVKTIKSMIKKSGSMISAGEALLIYRATPLTSGGKSPGNLMLGRKLATNLITFQTSDSERSNDNSVTPVPSNVPRFDIDDPVFVYNDLTKIWERGRVIGLTNQPNQYSVMMHTGSILKRNVAFLRPDQTDRHTWPQEPAVQNPEPDSPTEQRQPTAPTTTTATETNTPHQDAEEPSPTTDVEQKTTTSKKPAHHQQRKQTVVQPPSDATPATRKSSRVSKPPNRLIHTM